MLDDEDNEDKFLKENPIVFKKYKVIKKLNEGAFCKIYLGKPIKNNEYVVLKVEPRKIINPTLETEAFLLYSIGGIGIPEIKSFGRVKNFTVLIEPLLGKSLLDIFEENNRKMTIKDVCLIGKQVIDRIQWIHSKNIIHRDIKPNNILIGKKDPNIIYIIDFGLCRKYRSSKTNKHIKFGFSGKLTGTVRFASANALRGAEQSRRDDIESIGYLLVYLLKKRLPWQGAPGKTKMERYLKIYEMKKNISPQNLCSGLPPEMAEYIRYSKNLGFEQDPDYNYLRNLFEKMLKRIHNMKDQLIFSWIESGELSNLKNPINPVTRRDSPLNRIYKNIKFTLETERNLSFDIGYSESDPYLKNIKTGNKASNLNIVDSKSLFEDNEIGQKSERKINKQFLKAKEGLNTIIANLNSTLDDNILDFEEIFNKGQKNFGEFLNNNNNKKDSENKNYLDNLELKMQKLLEENKTESKMENFNIVRKILEEGINIMNLSQVEKNFINLIMIKNSEIIYDLSQENKSLKQSNENIKNLNLSLEQKFNEIDKKYKLLLKENEEKKNEFSSNKFDNNIIINKISNNNDNYNKKFSIYDSRNNIYKSINDMNFIIEDNNQKEEEEEEKSKEEKLKEKNNKDNFAKKTNYNKNEIEDNKSQKEKDI